MSNNLKIYILILNWNGINHLKYMLPSLLECEYPEHTKFIVIDADSNDNSKEYVESLNHKNINILKLDNNYGWAKSNNIGIRHAYKSGADIIVLLNNDMRFSKKWLINTLEIFNKKENVGMAGCEVITDKNKFEEFSAKKIPMAIEKVQNISGCCMIIPRFIFQKIGLINEEYIFYEEEIDFQKRIKLMGYNLFKSNAYVWHLHDGSMRNFPEKKAYLAIRNSILISRRYDKLIITFIKILNILLCSIIKNYRKHTMTNKRYYAVSPLKNFKIFIKAFSWNIADIFKRGYKAKVKTIKLD